MRGDKFEADVVKIARGGPSTCYKNTRHPGLASPGEGACIANGKENEARTVVVHPIAVYPPDLDALSIEPDYLKENLSNGIALLQDVAC